MLTRKNSLAGLAVFAVGFGGWAIAYAVFQVPTELIRDLQGSPATFQSFAAYLPDHMPTRALRVPEG